MLRRAGRIAHITAGHCGNVLHRVLELALAITVIAAVCLGLLAWRLSQGPMQLDWLANRMGAEMTADVGGESQVRVATAALAWEGFNGGVDRPLDIRLTGLTAIGADGVTRATIPRANVSLAVGALLLGRLIPRAVEIDGATLRVLRTAEGEVSLDLGGAAEADAAPQPGRAAKGENPFDRILTELGRAPESDRSIGPSGARLSQISRLLIRDARLTVVDQQLAATWRAPSARIDLRRGAGGGVTGDLDIQLAVGAATARLTATASLEAGGDATHVQAHITPVVPAVLAGAAPALASLAAIDAPVETTATLDLGPALAIRHASVTATMGPGTAHVEAGSIGLRGAELQLQADPKGVSLTRLRLVVPSPSGGFPDSVILASGRLARADGRLRAEATLDLDQVAFADLPTLWPPHLAHDARGWVTENITAGTARRGHLAVGLELAPDLSAATVTSIAGGVSGDDLTAWWLRPVPPLLHGQAVLSLDNPDALTIAVAGAVQAQQNGQPSGLAVRGGTMHITGLSVKDQNATLAVDLAGPLADTLALLRQPRLHLFDKRPLDLREPSGTGTAHLTLALPLAQHVTPEQIDVAAHAHLADVHLTGLVAGRNVDQGQLDLDVNTETLTVAGQAALAGIPAQVKVLLDFRPGPASQVVESVTAAARADEAQLRQAGLDSAGILVGPSQLNATYSQHRDGGAELAVRADMAAVAMGVSPLGWRKPPGAPASASVRVLLKQDRIVGLDDLRADGDGLLVRGSADYAGGQPNLLRLDQMVLGQTSAHGQVRFPDAPGQPIRVTLQGPKLDLSARLTDSGKTARPKPAPVTDEAGPAYVLDIRFDETMLAESRPLGALTAQVESDGHKITRARVDTSGAQHVRAEITPGALGRGFSLTAGDGGGLLRGLGITRAIAGGRLAIAGRFDDTKPARPLVAVAHLDEFRVNNAPAIGKLLQAMTLYGLVDALQGPGLGFSQLIAPFRLEGGRLELQDARAFSSSLGLTAKGRIDLDTESIDMQGTIVPAYFFNSLLGNVPLIGRLFSPEKDGGVFSATYALSGRLDDPNVSVNPLAALTPGFLRGVFGIFDQAGAK